MQALACRHSLAGARLQALVTQIAIMEQDALRQPVLLMLNPKVCFMQTGTTANCTSTDMHDFLTEGSRLPCSVYPAKGRVNSLELESRIGIQVLKDAITKSAAAPATAEYVRLVQNSVQLPLHAHSLWLEASPGGSSSDFACVHLLDHVLTSSRAF